MALRIAVISDTHDHLPESVCREIAAADEIWHLGDICSESILKRVQKIGPSVRWVRGNCDSEMKWPLQEKFALEGFRILLEHIPARRPSGCDLYFHGHTHVPRDETIRGVRILNPGCISRPNRGAPASYAWLTLAEDCTPEWKLVVI